MAHFNTFPKHSDLVNSCWLPWQSQCGTGLGLSSAMPPSYHLRRWLFPVFLYNIPTLLTFWLPSWEEPYSELHFFFNKTGRNSPPWNLPNENLLMFAHQLHSGFHLPSFFQCCGTQFQCGSMTLPGACTNCWRTCVLSPLDHHRNWFCPSYLKTSSVISISWVELWSLNITQVLERYPWGWGTGLSFPQLQHPEVYFGKGSVLLAPTTQLKEASLSVSWALDIWVKWYKNRKKKCFKLGPMAL